MKRVFHQLCPCMRPAAAAGEASSAVGGGGHDIGWLGSACLMSNNVCGSAMVQIPGLFQAVGWLPASITFVIVGIWSTVTSLYLTRLIQRLPGNAAFSQRVEFGRAAQILLPRWAYLGVVFILCASLISQNISNIVVSAQSVDQALLASTGAACALSIYDPTGATPPGFFCIHGGAGGQVTDSPFPGYVVSLGYAIIALVTVPLSYVALDGNIVFQIIGMALLTFCVFIWVVQFSVLGLQASLLPAVGAAQGGAYSSLIPLAVFNFGFVATVPSWLNEKGAAVPTASTLGGSVAFATMLYLLLGIFGGLALPFAGGADILSVIAQELPALASGPLVTVSQICCYVFPIANLVTSIPVFAIIVRYNLVNARLLPLWAAHGVAVALPWALSLAFYAGDQLAQLLNWSAAIFFVALNLGVPLWLYWAQTAAAEQATEALATGGGSDEGSYTDAAASDGGKQQQPQQQQLGDAAPLRPSSTLGAALLAHDSLEQPLLLLAAAAAAQESPSGRRVDRPFSSSFAAAAAAGAEHRGGGGGGWDSSTLGAWGQETGLPPASPQGGLFDDGTGRGRGPVVGPSLNDLSMDAILMGDGGMGGGGGGVAADAEAAAAGAGGVVRVLPEWLVSRYPRAEPRLVLGLFAAAAVLAAVALAVQVASAVVPSTASGS